MSKPVIFNGTKVKTLKGTLSLNGFGEINSSATTNLNLAVGGSNALSLDSSAVTLTSTLQLLNPLGNIGAPSYSFTGDSNTGIYSPGADQLSILTGGTDRMAFNTTTITTSLVSRGPDGSAGTPTWSFANDGNTGVYSFGADQLGFSTAGASVGNVSSTGAWSFGTTASALTHNFDGSTTSRIQVRRNTATATTGFFEAASGEINIGSITSTDVKFYYGGTIFGLLSSGGTWQLGSLITGGSITHAVQSSGSTALRIDASTAAGGQARLALKPGSSEDAYIKNEIGNNLNFENNTGTIVGKYSAAGLWTIGASGGTQVHAVNGSLAPTVAVQIGATAGTNQLIRTVKTGAFTTQISLENTNASGGAEYKLATNLGDTYIGGDSSNNYISCTGTGGLKIETTAASNADIFFRTNSTERMRIAFGGAVSMKGTSTNDSASAGFYGEAVRSAITTATNFPASGAYGDLTSISLTAGDWDVSAFLHSQLNGATGMDNPRVGISSTSGNSATGLQYGDNLFEGAPPTGGHHQGQTIPAFRVSLSATTTYYLKYLANYSTGTPQAMGRISARRVR